MTQEQFKQERLYQSTLTIAQTMHRQGLITDDEFRAIDTILLEKHRPLLGRLYAVKLSKSLDITALQSDI